ncbi:hypothetical protein MNBD_GAMMA23-2046 [hydrothermal vent metagenome]|uniref:HAMP domain-containing protein n=1 Tax=hydrothermal vent metagenome TaxID=652676 RepID=A0A3B0ZIW3_9ZZZZ
MKLTTKFNLILTLVLSISLIICAYFSYNILQKNAKREVVKHAGMMLEAALAIRGYTVTEIRPLLVEQMQSTFLPQSVPAYAATQSFNSLRKKHPQYSYKEATLNPTNLRNRATDWETDIVQEFSNNRIRKEVTGVRQTPTGPVLYLARPIQIKKQGCLTCHGTISSAPATLVEKYGTANGFGWKLNEIVGAQIVTVPMSLPVQKANEVFVTFMLLLIGVFLFIIVVLNIMLKQIIIKPVMRMAVAANKISVGKFDTPEFDESGKDEVAILSASFNRMRRSLQKAIKMLQQRSAG